MTQGSPLPQSPIPGDLQLEAEAVQRRHVRLKRLRARLNVLAAHNSRRTADLNAAMGRAGVHTIQVEGAILKARGVAEGLLRIDLGAVPPPPPPRKSRRSRRRRR